MSDWQDIATAPKDGQIILDLGETIPDRIDVRSGEYISEMHAQELGEAVSAAGGWLVWNSENDWFIIPFEDALGWTPLPL